VLIVGYKDDASAPGGGWFIMRNSWGERWAEKGYAYLSYDFLSSYGGYCYAAEPYSKPFQTTYSITPPSDDGTPANATNCDDGSTNPDCAAPSIPLNQVKPPNVIVAPDFVSPQGR
jgi:hypothetical protein